MSVATFDGLDPAIGYIRVSLAREEMISPELQRKSIEDWAKLTRHRIIDWVEDLDKTGRNFKRKIMHVIERIEAGDAKVIAVWKYSRFGRTRTGVTANLARVEKAGGALLSATEAIDSRTAIGRFQRGMIMEFNAFESDRAGEQWMETHQWRRDQGLPAMGKRRFGYIWHQRKQYKPDGTITLQEERYEPHPEQADVVVGLFERYIDGESFYSIAMWLNDNGYRTVRGQLWSAKAVIRYLDSGFAAGYLRLHRRDCPLPECTGDCTNYELSKHPTNHHTPLITEEVWKLYLQRRAEMRNVPPRAKAAKYPLTGLMRCGRCTGSAKRKRDHRSYVSYTCTVKDEKGKHACDGTSLSLEAILAGLRTFLVKVAGDVNAASGQVVLVSAGGHISAEERCRGDLESKVTRLERAIHKHMRVYAMSEDDDPDRSLEAEYLETLRTLRDEKAQASAELAKLSEPSRERDLAALRAAAVPVAAGLLEEWNTLPPERTNAMLRRVVARIVLQPGRTMDIVPLWEA